MRYVNQKVQTQQNGIFEGENMGVQCSYSNRMEDFLMYFYKYLVGISQHRLTLKIEYIGSMKSHKQNNQFLIN